MEEVVFLNGELLPRSQARISPFDHAFLYGHGLFETARAYSGVFFRLDTHLDRLLRSAAILGIPLPEPDRAREEMTAACYHTLRANNLQNARLRLTLSAGEGEPTPVTSGAAKPTLFVTARAYTPDPVLQHGGARATISGLRRTSRSLPSRLKTTSYLDSLMARREAADKGVDEALLLNEKGKLAEGSTSNVFVASAGTLVTPSVSTGLLAGITRAVVLELAKAEGVKVEEREVSPEELWTADEAFLTNSIVELLSLVEVDGKAIGSGKPGPLTLRLRQAYTELVLGEIAGGGPQPVGR